MKFSKDAALMALAIAVFLGTHAAVDALDRHDAEKAAEKRVEAAAPVYVVEVSEPVDVIELPIEPEVEIQPIACEEPAYSEADLEMLALVIYQEAGGDACSDETRLMVGNVVMNRVADDRFPNTIEEVLLQKQQYGRLHWTGLVWPERASQNVEAHAVARAYDCAERVLNGERLLPDDVIWQAEFVQGSEIIAEQDGFYFCR